MCRFRILISVFCLPLSAFGSDEGGPNLKQAAANLFEQSCFHCHDGSGQALDLTQLASDLADADTFRVWERVRDRVHSGQMPPAGESRPAPDIQRQALSEIDSELDRFSRKQRTSQGRVILRRLNRTEYSYTLQDLLGISVNVADMIPAENSTGFDTTASHQGFSSLHASSFLAAADAALDATMQFGKPLQNRIQRFPYKQQEGVRKNIDKKAKGHRSIVGELDDAIVMFSDASYIFKVHGLKIPVSGFYKVRAEAFGYQSEKPVVLSLNAGNYRKGQQRILDFFDLLPGEPEVVEVTAWLDQNEYLFPAPLNLDVQPDGKSIWNIDPEKYEGAGVALKWVEVEGPLTKQWPPQSTRDFFKGVQIQKRDRPQWNGREQIHYEIVTGDHPRQQLKTVVHRLASKAMRRPVSEEELNQFSAIGERALDSGRSLPDAIRMASRNVLSSPGFLFFTSEPGELDDYALASRLSYFLWKSLPDERLLQLARSGKLKNADVLRQQVDRLLLDKKSERFVSDFVGQWLRIDEIDETSPDDRLYPEFDDMLKRSMVKETEAFFQQLIAQNLSSDQLIDSDFLMLNRRLAEHYDIKGVVGQHIRKVALPEQNPRGGLVTQASILKITANGTVTSPVSRGSWVLTHLLGTPPSPPPPGVGSVEPDTRGATTIREALAKHRNVDACARCHQKIDPPGFALEAFDVIGGYRTRYRSIGQGDPPLQRLNGRKIWEYKLGLPVDSSGSTPQGDNFAGVREYKQLLMKHREQVARNLIRQLIVYSTGAEIGFADRRDVEELLQRSKRTNFGVKDIIHEVVQSSVFRNK